MNLSPGLANSCFELLALFASRQISIGHARASFNQIGVTQTELVIECCQGMRWLATRDDGLGVLTVAGQRLMAVTGHEARLRRALLDYLEIEQPFWVQDAAFGRRKALDFMNVAVAQVFLEAGLVDGLSDDVVAFWDKLAAEARGQKDTRMLEIGRRGEKLTLAYEESRTGKKPKWIAIDNNADSFDVLSIVDAADGRLMSIEVKSTSVGLRGVFWVTRNEWEIATAARAHCFHLWDISVEPHQLAFVSSQELASHVPHDKGSGEWKSVAIPFDAFRGRFSIRADLDRSN
jgi:hypothetical protein